MSHILHAQIWMCSCKFTNTMISIVCGILAISSLSREVKIMSTIINKDMTLTEGSIQDTAFTVGNPKGQPVLPLRYSFIISLFTSIAAMTGSQFCIYIFSSLLTPHNQSRMFMIDEQYTAFGLEFLKSLPLCSSHTPRRLHVPPETLWIQSPQPTPYPSSPPTLRTASMAFSAPSKNTKILLPKPLSEQPSVLRRRPPCRGLLVPICTHYAVVGQSEMPHVPRDSCTHVIFQLVTAVLLWPNATLGNAKTGRWKTVAVRSPPGQPPGGKTNAKCPS